MSTAKPNSKRRAIVLIIDGCGIGAAPDASKFGDNAQANSIANAAKKVGGLNLPNLASLGLGNITSIDGVPPAKESKGFFGKLEEKSCGKDTQTGHWELMGVVSNTAFPTYANGFPQDVLDEFIAKTGCGGVLCNKPISGTKVLEELGEQHQKTGYPIVYTSGDSVFQIACHDETVPLSTLYKWCAIARQMLQGKHRVGRVIARPFTGAPGKYVRLGGDRRDYSVPPPEKTLLDKVLEKGVGVLGIGKIEDIFDKHGLSHAKHTGSNKEGLELTLLAIKRQLPLSPIAIIDNPPEQAQFIFTNLVDTDMLYGHRRNVEGYAQALVEADEWIGQIMSAMDKEDMLVITSDHGNDPTAAGTDHTREFVPLLVYCPALEKASMERNLATRQGFSDVAATVANWFGLPWDGKGVPFVKELETVG